LEPAPEKRRWYLSVPSVLTALVLLGPLAFPLLWKSPAFTKFWKIFLTAAFAAATVSMLWGTGKIVEYALGELRRLQSTLTV
jgi:hypothetical protein